MCHGGLNGSYIKLSIGFPNKILTYNGSVFTSKVFKEVCQELGIQHARTTPFQPQTNGCLERFHGTLKHRLTNFENRRTEWDKLLNHVFFMYRKVFHIVVYWGSTRGSIVW